MILRKTRTKKSCWAFAPYAGKPGTGSPELPSILQGFYPRNSGREGTAERIASINLRLEALATEQGFFYTEPGRLMADESGRVPAELSSDGLHPSASGYERIASVLAPVIRRAAEERKNDTAKKPSSPSGVSVIEPPTE